MLDPVFFRPKPRPTPRLTEPVTARELSGMTEKTAVDCQRGSGLAGCGLLLLCECFWIRMLLGRRVLCAAHSFRQDEAILTHDQKINKNHLTDRWSSRFIGIQCAFTVSQRRHIETSWSHCTDIFTHKYVGTGSSLPHSIYSVQ